MVCSAHAHTCGDCAAYEYSQRPVMHSKRGTVPTRMAAVPGECARTASTRADSEPTQLPEHCNRGQHGATSALRLGGEACPTSPLL